MNKEIRYKGYSSQLSEYDCVDGELAMSLGMINETGSLTSIQEPGKRFNIGVGRRLFIHRAGVDVNYLSYEPNTGEIAWVGSEDIIFSDPRVLVVNEIGGIGKIVSIAAVGNIVIVSTEKGMYYFRWKVNSRTYCYLGNRIPDIRLDIGLKLNFTADEMKYNAKIIEAGDDKQVGSNDKWKFLWSTEYKFSTDEGSFSRENVTDPYYSKTMYVASRVIEFESSFVLRKGAEYKISFGADWKLYRTVIISGCRDGSSKREYIGKYQMGMSFKSESYWTNIAYQVYMQCEEGMQAELGERMTLYIGMDYSESGIDTVPWYIEYTEQSYNDMMGIMNKFVNERAMVKSKFIYPFYVRYALKMFDGSYSYVSEPMLMLPNTGQVPALRYSNKQDIDEPVMTAMCFLADLQYRSKDVITEEWRDLITGVDFFVSDPIWSYDQSQNYDSEKMYLKYKLNLESEGCGKAYFDGEACDETWGYGILNLQYYVGRFAGTTKWSVYVEVAPRKEEDRAKAAKSVSAFYKVGSIDTRKINESYYNFTTLEINEGTLSALQVQERLPDTVLPYKGYRNAYMKEYNNRLHIYHLEQILRGPVGLTGSFNYLDRNDSGLLKIDVYVKLSTEDGEKVVRSEIEHGWLGSWYFYPDNRAYKAYFVVKESSGNVIGYSELDLTQHEFLNGSYWFGENFLDSFKYKEGADGLPEFEENDAIRNLYTIYPSEVNNPFVYRAESAVSVGAQEVVSLASAAKALSQGQFGSFPLYAFTTEGIWALSVSGVGVYTAVQPITRDETINVESVTQIDSAVLFSSSRGVMMLSGSTVSVLTEAINNDYPFDLGSLPAIGELHEMIGHEGDDGCLPMLRFSEYLRDSRMLYDYRHQRVYVYNPKVEYSYLFSLKSKLWSMVYSRIASSVNSYPETLAVDSSGNVIDYSVETKEMSKGLVITRALKLDSADIYKTVDTVIQRGVFAKGHVKSVLYGSRDMEHWHIVRTSRDHRVRGFSGSPYKFYRIALVCDLRPGESLAGAYIQFRPKLLNRAR